MGSGYNRISDSETNYLQWIKRVLAPVKKTFLCVVLDMMFFK